VKPSKALGHRLYMKLSRGVNFVSQNALRVFTLYNALSKYTTQSPLEESAQQRREKRDPSSGGPGRAQQPGKMSRPKPDRASNLGKERWRSTRRSPPTVTFGDPPLGHPGASNIGRGRGGWQIPLSPGTSLSIPLSPSSLRTRFCVRWAKVGLGKSGSYRRKA